MRGHVDAESLALCAEGLLGRRRSGRIRSHIASCPECAATQARLTEVPALLARVPPSPMPPGIAARLDAALSAETARRAAQAPGVAPDHAEPDQRPATMPIPQAASPRAGRPRAGRPRGPRLRLPVSARVLATAGVLAVAGGVGYAVSQSSSPSASSSSGSASSGSGARAAPQVRSPMGSIAPSGQGGGTGLAVRHSGTSYHKDTLAAQAQTQLNTPPGLNRPGEASGGLSRQAPSSALTQCVDKVAGGPGAVRAGEVQLVDQARYQGHPATVIVLQPSDTQPRTVYVAGTGCSAADADILARASLPARG